MIVVHCGCSYFRKLIDLEIFQDRMGVNSMEVMTDVVKFDFFPAQFMYSFIQHALTSCENQKVCVRGLMFTEGAALK